MSKDFRQYRFGAKGDHVKSLQNALIAAGYELPQFGPDGSLGGETMTAVAQLEADHSFTNSLTWAIDASTLAFVLDAECPEPAPPPTNPNVPQGKGMFQRVWKHMGKTPQAAAQHIIEHGIKWVALQRVWQYANPNDDKRYNGSDYGGYPSKEWVAAIVEAGAQPWIWGWPHPGRQDDFVRLMGQTAEEWGAVGIIADCEAPWYEEGDTGEDAEELIDGLQETGLPVGVTSYGAPWNFPGLPWSEFVRADFGVPQIYDSNNNQSDNYPARSVDKWTELGFKAIVPASAAYNKTESQMCDLLRRTPTPENAIVWWDWYNANGAAYRWDVIKEYTLSAETRDAQTHPASQGAPRQRWAMAVTPT